MKPTTISLPQTQMPLFAGHPPKRPASRYTTTLLDSSAAGLTIGLQPAREVSGDLGKDRVQGTVSKDDMGFAMRHFVNGKSVRAKSPAEVLEPGEEMWGVYEYKKGFDGFSRLNMPTQDYVYRPLLYSAWRKSVELRRTRRHEERKKIELERAARGKMTNGAEKHDVKDV